MSSPIFVDLTPTSPAYSMALNLVIISIVLSAFALGISRALQSKKLWSIGMEELMQSVINAAMLGAIVSGAALSSQIASSMLEGNDFGDCTYLKSTSNSPIAYSACAVEGTMQKGWGVANELNMLSFGIGALSSMRIDINVVSAAPFDALSYSAKNYLQWADEIRFSLSLLEINRQALFFIMQAAFSLFLPVGLLLRLFFATRKLGGAIMAGAIGFFIVYPLAFCAFVWDFSSLEESYDNAMADLGSLSASLAPVPAIDWDKGGEIANLLKNLSGNEIASKTSLPYASVSAFEANLQMYAIVYPLICLLITIVSIREMAAMLGGEFKIDFFEKI